MSILYIFLLTSVSAFPLDWIQNVAENIEFESFDNYLPVVTNLPTYHQYSLDDFFDEENEINKEIKSNNNWKNDRDRNEKVQLNKTNTENEPQNSYNKSNFSANIGINKPKVTILKQNQTFFNESDSGKDEKKEIKIELVNNNKNDTEIHKEEIKVLLENSTNKEALKSHDDVGNVTEIAKNSILAINNLTSIEENKIKTNETITTNRTVKTKTRSKNANQKKRKGKTLDEVAEVVDFVWDGVEGGLELAQDVNEIVKGSQKTAAKPGPFGISIEDIFRRAAKAARNNRTIPIIRRRSNSLNLQNKSRSEIDPVFVANSSDAAKNSRPTRQDDESSESMEEPDEANSEEAKDSEMAESSEEESEEEDENMLTSLLSAFLGGLFRPDGTIDIEAITGLLGSLSAQNEDGTFDFSGLTELLMSFFGGDDEGGIDLAQLIGGLAAAFLKGVAEPPGAKGVGIFSGKVVAELIPIIFGPAPPPEGQEATGKPIDPVGFIAGFLSTLLKSIANMSSSGSGGGGPDKMGLVKTMFSMITRAWGTAST